MAVVPFGGAGHSGYFLGRYSALEKWLKAHREFFDEVMLSDVRDVVIQRDPFVQLRDLIAHRRENDASAVLARRTHNSAPPAVPPYILFSLEVKTMSIGSCPWNSNWIRRGYGDAMLRQLSSKLISCSGVTMASTALLLDYLQRIIGAVRQGGLQAGAEGMHGIDQGIHNVLVHTHYTTIPEALVLDLDDGPVFTMGYLGQRAYVIDRNERVINAHKRVPAVLHQFDRHPWLVNHLNTLYP